MPLPQWYEFLLSEYDNGQLQAGVKIEVPYRKTIRGQYVVHLPNRERQIIKAPNQKVARQQALELYGKNQVLSVRTHGKVVTKLTKVPGTRIPASTINKFRNGTYTPREKSLKKLKSFYHSALYRIALQQGYRKDDAKLASYRAPQDFRDHVIDFISNRDRIAKKKKIDPLYIAWGMSESDYHESDWDSYGDEL